MIQDIQQTAIDLQNLNNLEKKIKETQEKIKTYSNMHILHELSKLKQNVIDATNFTEELLSRINENKVIENVKNKYKEVEDKFKTITDDLQTEINKLHNIYENNSCPKMSEEKLSKLNQELFAPIVGAELTIEKKENFNKVIFDAFFSSKTMDELSSQTIKSYKEKLTEILKEWKTDYEEIKINQNKDGILLINNTNQLREFKRDKIIFYLYIDAADYPENIRQYFSGYPQMNDRIIMRIEYDLDKHEYKIFLEDNSTGKKKEQEISLEFDKNTITNIGLSAHNLSFHTNIHDEQEGGNKMYKFSILDELDKKHSIEEVVQRLNDFCRDSNLKAQASIKQKILDDINNDDTNRTNRIEKEENENSCKCPSIDLCGFFSNLYDKVSNCCTSSSVSDEKQMEVSNLKDHKYKGGWNKNNDF